MSPRPKEPIVVAQNSIVHTLLVDKPDQVLVDDLGDQRRIVGACTPRVDRAPSDLRIAFVVAERQRGEGGVMLADVVDDPRLPLDDAHRVGRQVLLVRPYALFVDRDERGPMGGFAGEHVGATVAVGQKGFQRVGEVPARAGASQAKLGIGVCQACGTCIVVDAEGFVALLPEADVRFIPGFKEPAADLRLSISRDQMACQITYETPPRACLGQVGVIVEIAADVAHQLEEGAQAVFDERVKRCIEARPIVTRLLRAQAFCCDQLKQIVDANPRDAPVWDRADVGHSLPHVCVQEQVGGRESGALPEVAQRAGALGAVDVEIHV